MTRPLAPAAVKAMLTDGEEIALIDVREELPYSQNHLLWARSVPLSRLALRFAQLVPRRTTRIVLCDDGSGLIDPSQIRLSPSLSVAGVVAIVTLLLSAVSAVSALRTAVRAMLGAEDRPNAVVGKLHELAGFVGIAVSVLVSAVLTLGLTTITDRLAGWVGHPGVAGPTTRVLGVLIAFVVDAATFVLVVRVLAGQKPPWRDLAGGAAIAGVGLGVLRLLGTSAVSGSLRSSKALVPFALIVVLLAWVNLMARIVLTAAAWTANPPLPPAPPPPPAEQAHQLAAAEDQPAAPSPDPTPPQSSGAS